LAAWEARAPVGWPALVPAGGRGPPARGPGGGARRLVALGRDVVWVSPGPVTTRKRPCEKSAHGPGVRRALALHLLP